MANDSALAPTSKFEQTLRASAKMPGVRINRSAFLRSELKRFCSEEQIARAIAETPWQVPDSRTTAF